MIEIETWVAMGAGLLTAGAGAVNLGGLLRAFLRQRARLRLERERSARSAVRSAALVNLVRATQGKVRVVERDGDGHRTIDVDRSGNAGREAA